MREMSEDQYKLMAAFLEYKYYMPEIVKIYSIKDNMRGSIFVKPIQTKAKKQYA